MESVSFSSGSVTMACLPGLLIWALFVQLANTCLHCWPYAAKYFRYDVQLLLGGNKDVAEKLETLFLGSTGKCDTCGSRFLEWEDMQRETGNLFLQLQQITQENKKDPERLLTKAGQAKQNFSKRLIEASSTFLKEICSASCEQIRFRPYEVAECRDCHLLKAPCNDSLVCAGPNVLAGVLVTLVILLTAGVGVWYYRRKRARKGETKAQEDDGTESSDDSWSSEWSEDTGVASPPAEKTPNSTNAPNPSSTQSQLYQNVPAYQNVPTYQNKPLYQNAPIYQNRPLYQNVPTYQNKPLYQNIPTYQNLEPIPSPPHIWSPPS